MVTQSSEQQQQAAVHGGLGQRLWAGSVQAVAVALTGLALSWAPAPDKPDQALLVLLALALLAAALVPRLRHGRIAASLGGVSLALACWLSAERTWDLPAFAGAYIPLMTPVVGLAAVICAVWGAVARMRLAGPSPLGVAACLGGALVAAWGTAFFLVINRSPAFKARYVIDLYQLQEMIAVAVLYPGALWLGGTGIRPGARWPIALLGQAGVIIIFLCRHVR